MELEPWLLLLQATRPPATRAVALLRELGDVQALLAMHPAELQAAGLSAETCHRIRHPDNAAVAACCAWLAADGRSLVPIGHASYPQLLTLLPDPPLALWVLGNPQILNEPQLAIVGSRNPTQGGLANARGFARALGEAGLTITSGLALGIDGAGHAGALDGDGATVAVLACGPDIIYPRQHQALARTITARGALISEYVPGTQPERHHFPCRNRLIAGLSVGTLVIEATRQSGSLITARLAGDYGREVFAIPGSIHNPMARGCHQLIRQGAKLVEEAADVLRELAPQLAPYLAQAATSAPPSSVLDRLDPSYATLLETMGFDPVSIADLTKRSGLTAAELSSMLLVLELEGLVEALPGSRYSRIEKAGP